MPSWKELRRFCQKDGWSLYKDTDHYYYRKKTADGRLIRTKVSKGSGEIPKGLWKKILYTQLEVDEEYFNKLI